MKKQQNIELNQQNLGFLLHDVARLLRRNFDRRVQTLELTQAQWKVLIYLSRNEGIKQAQLAEFLEVQPISVGRLIDRMEAAEWVVRKPDATDRRAFNLYLTDKAEPILKKMQEYGRDVREEALAGISAKGRDELLKNLAAMRQNLVSICGTENEEA
ncbi:MAG: MarR family transcriptional regulator [Micavibrio sp.]|nr:MarR family transcriptional regulator [Micavibrio sp.]|tara:strand:- start:18 stop:488 length:471 start_codon:yes stop_codon:yes gene_type:complete